MAQPIVSWYDVTNTTELTGVYDFQVVDAGNPSAQHTFLIWNNKGDQDNDVSKMEDATITTVDMSGGDGNTAGNIVEVVKDKWFYVKVDSLNQANFTQIGGSTAKKDLGTSGKTTHPKSATASAWQASAVKALGVWVAPTTPNGFIYVTTASGTTGATEPSWATTEGATVNDGTAVWKAVKIEKSAGAKEILGGANDGDITKAGANFSKVTLYAEVPISASAGRQDFKLRASYRYV